MKRCTKCGDTKPLTEFVKQSSKPDGLRSWCKRCEADYKRDYRLRYKEKHGIGYESAYKSRYGRSRNYVREYACRKSPEYRARENARRRRRDVKQYDRARNLRVKYGLEQREYDALLWCQKGVCAICGTDTPRGVSNKWHVDHCHDTDQVRGLLCNRCNTTIGKFHDSPVILQRAIDYLTYPPAPAVLACLRQKGDENG